ncbi:MAG: hypothetical protein H6672_06345 [Anaerolineaceae bacterium]|nr:hypothetical protein [Anaerolineaceae bacterium]
MRRLMLLLMLLGIAAAVPVAAQDTNVITLDDTTPTIDIIVTLPDNTTGTVALNFSGAAVTMTDAADHIVFLAGDSRLHGFQLNILPNTGSHTLKVERLPGVTQAQVSVATLADPTPVNPAVLVSNQRVSPNEGTSLTLDPANPRNGAVIHIPQDTVGVMAAEFPELSAASQLVDASGRVLAASTSGHIDGITYLLDAGDYLLIIGGSGLTDPATVAVSVATAADSNFTVLGAPVTPATVADTSSVAPCLATVSVSSINLRSGPGTGYSVLGYGLRNEVFPVGGRNPENSWAVVGTASGSAWVSLAEMTLSGACDGLAVYNIPYRDAQSAQLAAAPQPSPPAQQPGSHDDEQGEHDD